MAEQGDKKEPLEIVSKRVKLEDGSEVVLFFDARDVASGKVSLSDNGGEDEWTRRK